MNAAKPTHFRPGAALAGVGFFSACFVYVWQRVEPAMEFTHSGPDFFWGWQFRAPFLTYPGGPMEYLATLLAQADCSNWLGAALATLLAMLTVGVNRLHLKRFGAPAPLAFVAGFAVLALRTWADRVWLVDVLGFLIAAGLAVVPSWMPTGKPWLRWGLVVAASCGVFFVAGLAPAVLCVVLVALNELSMKRPPTWATGGLVAALGLLAALRWLGRYEQVGVMSRWQPGAAQTLTVAFFLLLPVLGVAAEFWRRRGARPKKPRAKSVKQPLPLAPEPTAVPRWLGVAALVVGVAAFGLLFWIGPDCARHAEAALDYYTRQGEFEKAVAAAAAIPRLSAASETQLHKALYHAGRLGDGLFACTNEMSWNLFAAMNCPPEAWRAQAETLLELGQVYDAEHLGHEALEIEGNRPDLLWLLARVNLLKDRPRAARVFLKVLRQSPPHRAVADAWLAALETGASPPGFDSLREIRGRMVTTDLPHTGVPTDQLMQQSLHSNPTNRMAFEYLMTHYLLTGELDKFVKRLGQMDAAGIKQLPRHYAEAILVHQRLKQIEVPLGGRQIPPEVRARFARFTEFMERGAHQTPAGREEMARELGDTYWFYRFLREPATQRNSEGPVEQ